MKLAADTNVLITAAVQDDLHQARQAAKMLAEADLIAVSALTGQPRPFSIVATQSGLMLPAF